jgi:hypothetical protein
MGKEKLTITPSAIAHIAELVVRWQVLFNSVPQLSQQVIISIVCFTFFFLWFIFIFANLVLVGPRI